MAKRKREAAREGKVGQKENDEWRKQRWQKPSRSWFQTSLPAFHWDSLGASRLCQVQRAAFTSDAEFSGAWVSNTIILKGIRGSHLKCLQKSAKAADEFLSLTNEFSSWLSLVWLGDDAKDQCRAVGSTRAMWERSFPSVPIYNIFINQHPRYAGHGDQWSEPPTRKTRVWATGKTKCLEQTHIHVTGIGPSTSNQLSAVVGLEGF